MRASLPVPTAVGEPFSRWRTPHSSHAISELSFADLQPAWRQLLLGFHLLLGTHGQQHTV